MQELIHVYGNLPQDATAQAYFFQERLDLIFFQVYSKKCLRIDYIGIGFSLNLLANQPTCNLTAIYHKAVSGNIGSVIRGQEGK